MRTPGRISAAIEVLSDVLGNNRPVSIALQGWARGNRYAGSGDRAAIGNLVFDCLRCRSSLAHRMSSEDPRALVLAALLVHWDMPIDEIADHCTAQYGPGELTADERMVLAAEADAPPAWVAGDYPDWLQPSFERAFGAAAAEEGKALAERAPVDLRVNTLKADMAKVTRALAKYNAEPGPLSPMCLRLPAPVRDGRHPNVEADPAHVRGLFEVQDAGSQIAALMSGAHAGMQVADICAGAGGKTLAMAAMMHNKGQLHAYDADKHRLKPIFERLKRAGARNVQVIPADEPARLEPLAGRMDVVLVDAPCSGSGAWRRRPDTKWRLTPQLLEQRMADQRTVLAGAAGLVKPGGRLVYITCSVLPQENSDQVSAFTKERPQFSLQPYADVWREAIGSEPPASADGSTETLLLTPASHGTDGFFIAVMQLA
ncbi:MAG: RsmB/NOP family class I SAM-dependent RNA methyltransferase [Hyphomicrobiales bacterium]|nr:RsmB/NOP family class I SAM-dependent RNA methyltransferase [Hyphomicrobiales bacterium]